MTTRTNKKKVTKKTTKKKVSKKVTTRKKPVNTEEKYVFGRPTKYKKEFCQELIEKMAEGYSKEAVAGHLNISKNTLYEWAEKYPDFKDAISIGETKSRLFWEGSLVKHHIHTKNGKQLNGQVFNLNMKNRFGWADKHDVTNEEKKKEKKSFAFSLDHEPKENHDD